MRDALKATGFTLLGLALFSGIAAERVKYSAKRDIEASIQGARVRVSVVPRGLLGLAIGQADRATVYGRGFRVDELPFRQEAGRGLTARLGKLRFDLHAISLGELPVDRLLADIPNVKVDGPRVMFTGHMTIRSAGEGTAEAVLTAEGLRRFLSLKRPEIEELQVTLLPGGAIVSGR